MRTVRVSLALLVLAGASASAASAALSPRTFPAAGSAAGELTVLFPSASLLPSARGPSVLGSARPSWSVETPWALQVRAIYLARPSGSAWRSLRPVTTGSLVRDAVGQTYLRTHLLERGLPRPLLSAASKDLFDASPAAQGDGVAAIMRSLRIRAYTI